MKVLCVGDIVGKAGRLAVKELLPKLVDRHQVDVTIANGENAAGGIGTNVATATEILNTGVALLTGGNHTWRHKDYVKMLDKDARVLRPLNLPEGTPGRGYGICESAGGVKVGVINLQGRIFMEPLLSPFETVLPAIEALKQETPIVIVDIHAEATSEKRALGWHLDGKVSAVFGTHTHVLTGDEEVLPNGTGYITDIGMTGPHASIIGMKIETTLKRFLTLRPVTFETAKQDVRLCGAVFDIDETTGRTRQVTRIREALGR